MTGSLVSPSMRQRVREGITPLARGLARLGLTPNALTIVGFIGTCGAALAAANQAWLLAGLLVMAFGVFDLFDGAVARATGQVTRFGAFLDSTLDRTGENLVLAGIAVGCASAFFVPGAVVAVLALAFASVVTYARAKAEVVGLHGEVGFAPREVRIAVLALGLLGCGVAGGVEPSGLLPLPPPTAGGSFVLFAALGFIAALSALTVAQRIIHVKRQLDQQSPPQH